MNDTKFIVPVLMLMLLMSGITGLSQTAELELSLGQNFSLRHFTLTQPLSSDWSLAGTYRQSEFFQMTTLGLRKGEARVVFEDDSKILNDIEFGLAQIAFTDQELLAENHLRTYFSVSGIDPKHRGYLKLTYASCLDPGSQVASFKGRAFNFYLTGFQSSFRKGAEVTTKKRVEAKASLKPLLNQLEVDSKINPKVGLELREFQRIERRWSVGGGLETKLLKHNFRRRLILEVSKNNTVAGIKLGKSPQIYFSIRIQKSLS